ncbi:hypothetical protein [Mycoplasma miroungirhinis]|uniref:Lipoprotein n=1 Tax=Mycoplasma miroungirhinis TaxID=754516 RepID=A0A6M4JBU4_9MOLU|nr:hypothetical protein [Mycoplasma miroungirhinis]QJR44434.1 hypothetical protein HLA92_00005 [Mycoplasma miroungirhinis]
MNLLLIPALTIPFTVAACATPSTEIKKDTSKTDTKTPAETKKETPKTNTTTPETPTPKKAEVPFKKLDSGFHFETISNYFKYNDKSNDILKFKTEGAEASKIEFKNLTKNNYIPKYLNLDESALKNILTNELKIDSKIVNDVKVTFDYHNIRVDDANIHNAILPVKIIVPAKTENNDKKLFT